MCIISCLIDVLTRPVDPVRYDQWSDRDATSGLTAMRPVVALRHNHWDMFSMLRSQTLGRTAVIVPFQTSYYTFKLDQNWRRYSQDKCTVLRAATDGLCAEICSLCSAVRPWVALRWLVRFKQATTHSNRIRIEEDIVKTSVLCSALRPMVCVRRYVLYAPQSDHRSHRGGWSVSNELLHIQIGSELKEI